MKKVVILGATGSVGEQALEVVSGSDELAVIGLAASSSWERLVEQARDHGVPAVALADPGAALQAAKAWNGRVLAGDEGVRELIAASEADLVLNGIVGSTGLGPTIVALTEGIDVALANKESLVVGGEPGHRARRGHRRPNHPGRLRALRPVAADRCRAAGPRGATGPDRLRRSVPGPNRPLRRDA